MAKTDLILLHAPNVYDFRKKTILHGPVSDLVPPSPVFEMYPIGLASIAEYLERAGYHVRIVNLAVRMIKSKKFDADSFIKKLDAPLFGVDLHWLVHGHGAIEIVRLVKKHHPQAKVVMGGIASSYFYQQLLEYPEVDFVLRGDSTEEPFRQLMEAVMNKTPLDKIPNLAWRDESGKMVENPFSHVPDDLSPVMINHYSGMVRSVARYLDMKSILPAGDWLKYPITATLTCRGCTHACVICGGSAAGYHGYMNRSKPVYRTPQQVLADIKNIGDFSRGPVFVLGDIRQPGMDYANELLDLLEKNRVKNDLMFELFTPASREFLARLGRVSPGYCLEISPETHDDEVRRVSGKHYTTAALEQTVADALDTGCGNLQLFFMIGLPQQTPQSVMDTIKYCGHLMECYRNDRRLSLFIGPLAPFLDPGSIAFENAEKYGYRILFKRLEEHRQALLAPSWQYTLNYETEWMNRNQIMNTTYQAVLELNRLKAEYGFVSKEAAAQQDWRIRTALELEGIISQIWEDPARHHELEQLKPRVDRINSFRAHERKELELPVGLRKLRLIRSLKALFTK